MRIEEDEQVGRPVALILTVVTLDLARRRRDRLADFADEELSKQTTGCFGSGSSA